MSELGLASILLLEGIGLGMGSVFLSMWLLPALLKRLDEVRVLSKASYDQVLPKHFADTGRQMVRGSSPEAAVNIILQNQPEIVKGSVLENRVIDGPVAAKKKDQILTNSPDGSRQQDVISTEIMAAIAVTLCAYGLDQNDSYQIKRVRVVN